MTRKESAVSDPTVTEGATAPDARRRSPVRRYRGIRGGLLALARAAAFTGLLLAGTVLLLVTAAPPVVAGLGLGPGFQNLKPGQNFWPEQGFGLAWLGFLGPGLAWLRA